MTLTVTGNNDLSDSTEKFKQEIKKLQKQTEELKETIQYLEKVSETKERTIGSLARDKEKLASELRKERRSTVNLRQQLTEERSFYLKEKQQCYQEISKRDKRKYKSNDSDKIESLRADNVRLKAAFDETSQTNYNLCIKFLRMKNTKDDLKKRFQRYQAEQSTILLDLVRKLDGARNELDIILSQQFQRPLSLSNRKFLEIVKRNSQLIHENLCLRAELEKSVNQIERLKTSDLKERSKVDLPLLNTSSNDKISVKVTKSVSSTSAAFSNLKPSTLDFLKLDLKSCASTVLSNSMDSIRNRSAPALLQLKEFKQIKSTATQTEQK